MQTAPTTNPRTPLQLVFRLGSQTFGVDVMKVREIVGPQEITSVPNAQPAVKGVINLRGRVLPVVDLRVRLGMDVSAPTAKSCMLIARTQHAGGEVTVAMAVDEVIEVAPGAGAGRTMFDVDEVLG